MGEPFDPEAAPPRFEDLSNDYQRAWNIFSEVRNQVIMSPTGAILGLNVLALDFFFRIYNILPHKQASIYEKVKFIFEEVAEITKPPEDNKEKPGVK